ncbi:phosphoserine phosphatase SerB [uncultured Dermacoccus sp.]|uniref:phosphoserine phosphatase SerB n=1 Tax=uncultured Dermacoccus sp. TaxID=339343 RepID=UPI00259AA565|nr:phosphoserine phosphatase SerB [uncultured Dermacoccus sp.]
MNNDARRTDLLGLTFQGTDSPGLFHELTDAMTKFGVEIVDVGQAVLGGGITLSFLVSAAEPDELVLEMKRLARLRSLALTLAEGMSDDVVRLPGRAVVTLLAPTLPAEALAEVSAEVVHHGGNIDRVRRLARTPVTAIELDVSGVEVIELRRRVLEASHETGCDASVAEAGLARRGRRLVVLDVDSTLIQDEVIELLAARAGREAEVAEVTERAMRGEIDFAESLHERVEALAGLPASVLDEVRAEIRLTPGARTLVRTLKRLGFTVGVVSGGFIEVVAPLAASLGIDHARANTLEIVDGALTGRVLGDVVDREGKARALAAFAEAEHLPLARTVAIGDGANDLDMLALAGLGIAFNAKPVVRAQADASVNVPYLDSVLFFLGISRDDIEEADDLDALETPDGATIALDVTDVDAAAATQRHA